MNALSANILLVESGIGYGHLVQRMLEKSGYSCDYLSSPLEAIRHLQQKRYNVLIADMNMPKLTGLELFLWAQHHDSALQGLITTDYPTDLIEQLTTASGALALLVKPFEDQELLRLIRLCLAPRLSSELKKIQIMDLLQVIALEPQETFLEFKNDKMQFQAQLGIQKGIVKYCACSSPEEFLKGESAFWRLLTLKEGSFEELHSAVWQPNLEISVVQALLNASQFVDESINSKNVGNQHYAGMLCVSDNLKQVETLIRILENQKIQIQQEDFNTYKTLPSHYSLLFHLTDSKQWSHLSHILALNPGRLCIVLKPSFISVPDELQPLLHVFDAPWDYLSISQFLKPFHTLGFSGQLYRLSLLSQIQVFLMDSIPKKLAVRNFSHRRSGTIYLAKGRILEAQMDHLHGEEAFLKMTQSMTGAIFEMEWEAPSSNSLENHLPFKLLLQASENVQNLKQMREQILDKVNQLLLWS